MRSSFVCSVVVAGTFALVAAGCNTNKGAAAGFAAKEKTDWFGMSALAAMLKPDPKPMQTTDPASKTDPTSLAHKNKPLGSDLYVHAAHMYEKKGQFDAAEDQYLRALELNSNDTAAISGYAKCLDRQGKFEAATDQYRAVVAMQPQDAAAHNDLGLCYARRGMINESLAELSRAVELDPQKQLYRNNIATVFVEMGRTQYALAHLMAIDQPAVAHYNLACLLHQRGQSQAAGQHFAQAATLDPSLVMAREWAARLGAMPAQSQPVGPRLTNVRVVDPSANYSRAASYQPAVNSSRRRIHSQRRTSSRTAISSSRRNRRRPIRSRNRDRLAHPTSVCRLTTCAGRRRALRVRVQGSGFRVQTILALCTRAIPRPTFRRRRRPRTATSSGRVPRLMRKLTERCRPARGIN